MTARYQDLADQFIQRIRSGELPPGAGLPSESQLAAETGLSRVSVRRALEVLQVAGLITVTKGRGASVRVPRARIVRDANARYRWEKARAQSDDPEARAEPVVEHDSHETPRHITADYERIGVDAQLAADLGIVAGAEVVRRTYWTEGADGHQMVASVSHIPVVLIEANPELLDASNEPWPGGTIHQLSTVGIEVASITDRVTARPPTPAEAAELGTGAGTSLLCIRKISHDTTGRVVEISETLLAGDRTELVYTVEL